MKWFREARFGMFIHWGLYAVPAGEWKGKLIPGLGEFIRAAADVWVLIATVVAVRQALDYRSLPRAVGVCLIGWILQIVVFAIIRRALV